MGRIIDGKAAAEAVVSRVTELASELVAAGSPPPGLAVVIVGEDPASQVYVASKSKKARECGFLSVQHTLPADTSEAALLKLIDDLNVDEAAELIALNRVCRSRSASSCLRTLARVVSPSTLVGRASVAASTRTATS